jgi:hypothetical protein
MALILDATGTKASDLKALEEISAKYGDDDNGSGIQLTTRFLDGWRKAPGNMLRRGLDMFLEVENTMFKDDSAAQADPDKVDVPSTQTRTARFREPPEIYKQIAKYYAESGQTQEHVAVSLNKRMRERLATEKLWPLTQPKVHRIIYRVNRWNKAMGLPPIQTRKRKVTDPIDPAAIEMGEQVEQRTKRQRGRKSE